MQTDIRLRSSACVELQPLTSLTAAQRELLADLEKDPEIYALLVPKPPLTINLKAVTRRTAELFRSFATPSPLAEHARSEEDSLDVVELVLDGIFEIESSDGFVSGADALPLLAPHPAPPVARTPIARLSHEALLYAQDLVTRDPSTLTSALYRYNRIPVSPFWSSRFADTEAILAYLGANGAALRGLLERHWETPFAIPGFRLWPSRVNRTVDSVTFKLYVSPRPEHLRDAFEIVVRVLAEFPEAGFKLGNDAGGLLRPDKLMVYFPTREQLGEAASELRRELSGCDAQGVPFSAALDDSGLLSWGADPPDRERTLQWTPRDSWRSWVAGRLAEALAVAKGARSAAAVEPWRFALERVRRQGVDVETWTPRETLWSAT